MTSLLQQRTIYTGERVPASIVMDEGRLQVRRVNVEMLSLADSDWDSDDSGSGSGQVGGTRKRRRLTNLSPEEKMIRRKLKNRVAAQTARDRKKQKMSELEDALAVMEAENRKLQAENDLLKRSTNTLSRENVQLKERLQAPAIKVVTVPKEKQQVVKAEVSAQSCGVVVTEKLSEPESAVLSGPQQQELARTILSLATTQYLSVAFLIVSLMHCMTFWTSSTKTSASQSQSITTEDNSMCPSTHPHSTQSPRNPSLPPWWGSHQRNWNPSMNS
jgi:X box-binding protein 1